MKALDQLSQQASNTHRRYVALCTAFLLMGCEPVRDPPAVLFFGGLPVSGSLADARRAGFDACFNMDAINVRCRRRGVMFEEFGPYEAAVDLKGSDGQGGFDEVILWHIRDNDDVFKVKDMLKERGWSECWTGTDRAGDQAILTREGSPVRVFMDLSYYAKRRLRFVPEWNKRERRCTPTADPTTS